MGKKIDRFVCTLVIAAALYFYFRAALGNRLLALALALFACAVLCRLLRRLWTRLSKGKWIQMRRIRKSAGSISMYLACLPREEALAKLEMLLKKSYAGEYAVELVQAPPSGSLSQRELFEVWKTHRDAERLAVCATCECDSSCRMLAATLRQPRIALIDAQLLAQLAAAHPGVLELPGEAQRPHRQLGRSLHLLINRKNAPRCFLFSVSMLILYALSANPYYLISSMAFLFLALASLHRAPRPAKLF